MNYPAVSAPPPPPPPPFSRRSSASDQPAPPQPLPPAPLRRPSANNYVTGNHSSTESAYIPPPPPPPPSRRPSAVNQSELPPPPPSPSMATTQRNELKLPPPLPALPAESNPTNPLESKSAGKAPSVMPGEQEATSETQIGGHCKEEKKASAAAQLFGDELMQPLELTKSLQSSLSLSPSSPRTLTEVKSSLSGDALKGSTEQQHEACNETEVQVAPIHQQPIDSKAVDNLKSVDSPPSGSPSFEFNDVYGGGTNDSAQTPEYHQERKYRLVKAGKLSILSPPPDASGNGSLLQRSVISAAAMAGQGCPLFQKAVIAFCAQRLPDAVPILEERDLHVAVGEVEFDNNSERQSAGLVHTRDSGISSTALHVSRSGRAFYRQKEYYAVSMDVALNCSTESLGCTLAQLSFLHALKCETLLTFHGAGYHRTVPFSSKVDEPQSLCGQLVLLQECCSNGRLVDVIRSWQDQRSSEHDRDASVTSPSSAVDSVLCWEMKMCLILDIAKALTFLHEHRIVYGNLTSSAVHVTEEYVAKIECTAHMCDRRLCSGKQVPLSPDAAEIASSSGNVIINPMRAAAPQTNEKSLYSSPEKKVGVAYDTNADIFALGIIMFELMTEIVQSEQRCFQTESHNFKIDDSPLHRAVKTGCPVVLEAIAYQCCKTEPNLRPTAAQIVVELECLLDGIDLCSSSLSSSYCSVRDRAPYTTGVTAGTPIARIIRNNAELAGSSTQRGNFVESIAAEVDHKSPSAFPRANLTLSAAFGSPTKELKSTTGSSKVGRRRTTAHKRGLMSAATDNGDVPMRRMTSPEGGASTRNDYQHEERLLELERRLEILQQENVELSEKVLTLEGNEKAPLRGITPTASNTDIQLTPKVDGDRITERLLERAKSFEQFEGFNLEHMQQDKNNYCHSSPTKFEQQARIDAMMIDASGGEETEPFSMPTDDQLIDTPLPRKRQTPEGLNNITPHPYAPPNCSGSSGTRKIRLRSWLLSPGTERTGSMLITEEELQQFTSESRSGQCSDTSSSAIDYKDAEADHDEQFGTRDADALGTRSIEPFDLKPDAVDHTLANGIPTVNFAISGEASGDRQDMSRNDADCEDPPIILSSQRLLDSIGQLREEYRSKSQDKGERTPNAALRPSRESEEISSTFYESVEIPLPEEKLQTECEVAFQKRVIEATTSSLNNTAKFLQQTQPSVSADGVKSLTEALGSFLDVINKCSRLSANSTAVIKELDRNMTAINNKKYRSALENAQLHGKDRYSARRSSKSPDSSIGPEFSAAKNAEEKQEENRSAVTGKGRLRSYAEKRKLHQRAAAQKQRTRDMSLEPPALHFPGRRIDDTVQQSGLASVLDQHHKDQQCSSGNSSVASTSNDSFRTAQTSASLRSRQSHRSHAAAHQRPSMEISGNSDESDAPLEVSVPRFNRDEYRIINSSGEQKQTSEVHRVRRNNYLSPSRKPPLPRFSRSTTKASVLTVDDGALKRADTSDQRNNARCTSPGNAATSRSSASRKPTANTTLVAINSGVRQSRQSRSRHRRLEIDTFGETESKSTAIATWDSDASSIATSSGRSRSPSSRSVSPSRRRPVRSPVPTEVSSSRKRVVVYSFDIGKQQPRMAVDSPLRRCDF